MVTSPAKGGRGFRQCVTPTVVLDVPFPLPDCRTIVADYIALRRAFGPLDFEGFCAGCVEHGKWLAMRDGAARTPSDAGVQSKMGERRERASYAP